jgi:hypothetical protein
MRRAYSNNCPSPVMIRIKGYRMFCAMCCNDQNKRVKTHSSADGASDGGVDGYAGGNSCLPPTECCMLW